jgi:pimeloyl-ACP methyl ester carboxylesterase
MTSVTLGPVAEAFGVHEITSYTITVSQPLSDVPALAIPDAPPLPFIGPAPDDASDRVQGTRLLQQLALLPADSIRTWVMSHPDSIANLLASPPPAHDVTLWWQSLDFDAKLELRSSTPQLVGNLDGVPYTIRDSANRTVLTSTMRSLTKVIATESGRTVVENAKQQLHMLQSISDALGDSGGSAATRTLMTLDVTGQGRAAIVIGDLATADYVSYLVPGMFFTIENQMGDWVDAASRLGDEERSWLALLGPGAGSATTTESIVGVPQATPSVATIAWIGYHTPNLTNVGGLENAYEGRDSLADAIQGLQALRAGDEPYISIIAHSYGSTAALMALTEYDFEVDALAMVGSPGSPAKSVAELHVRDGNVYVGEAAWDPIPNSSYFGSDPGAKSYGAKPMGVGGGTDSITRQVLAASLGHNEYFSPGTESMRNFALIAIGQGTYVSN